MTLHDRIAEKARTASIPQQFEALEVWISTMAKGNDGRAKLAEWVTHFQVTETKKKGFLLVKLSLRSGTPMAATMAAFRFLFMSCEAQFLDGTAPSGPLFHNKKH